MIWIAIRYLKVEFSRSRPYQKNDNRFVEQKNDSLVRNYFGFECLGTVLHVQLMNRIYDKMWLYHNFFLRIPIRANSLVILSFDLTRTVGRGVAQDLTEKLREFHEISLRRGECEL